MNRHLIPKNSWITLDTWLCLQHIAETYLSNKSLHIFLEEGPPVWFLCPMAPLYIFSNFPPTKYVDDAILIYSDVRSVKFRGIRGRVVVATSNLDNIKHLWDSYRLFHLLVVIPFDNNCKVYTWSCNSSHGMQPKYQNTWKQGRFLEISTFYQTKASDCLKHQAFKYIHHPYPLYSYLDILGGQEDHIIKILAEKIGFITESASLPEGVSFYDTYLADGSLSGYIGMLDRREVDIAYGATFLMYENTLFSDFLPIYATETATWTTKASKPKPLSSGIFLSFSIPVWVFILLVSITFTIVYKIVSEHDISNSILSAFKILLQQSVIRSHGRSLELFLFGLYNFYSMLIVWFYGSFLLRNLFSVAFEKGVSTLEEATAAGYTVVLSNTFGVLVNDLADINWTFYAENDYVYWRKQALSKNGILMLVSTTYDQNFVLEKNPGLTLHNTVKYLPTPFVTYSVTMYMPIGHPFKSIISEKLMLISDAGLLSKWRELRKFLGHWDKGKSEFISQPLKIEHLLLSFNTWALLLFLSIIAFIIEFFWEKL